MRSAALALTWQTWGRHRWGLLAVALVLGAVIALQRSLPSDFVASETGVALFSISLGFGFVYLAYAFSLTEVGPRTRASSFPAWMFTLPARTPVLVAPAMLSGTLTVALTWVAAAELVLNRFGLD